jgi:tRNA threonylcarbamoyl adenosine modification protein YeaZ
LRSGLLAWYQAGVRLLAIDTATALCGVAVLEVPAAGDGAERSAVRRERVTTHSERLLSLIADCLGELGLVPAQLDAVVCSAGPGSFTGLRIGVATAKGLCFALSRSLVLLSSLETLAEGAPRPSLAVLDAGRGQLYARLLPPVDEPDARIAALLDRHPTLQKDALWQPSELVAALAPIADRLTVCGPDAARFPELLSLLARRQGEESTRPLVLARLGLQRLRTDGVEALDEAAPNYICPSAAEAKAAADAARQPGA